MNEHQKTLTGQKISVVPSVCCSSCYNASKPRCRCGCGGTFHGLGVHGHAKEDQKNHEHLTGKEYDRYSKQIPKYACTTCGYYMRGEPILMYDHNAGWPVEGKEVLQWLWITCPKCGYENSLEKLGVER